MGSQMLCLSEEGNDASMDKNKGREEIIIRIEMGQLSKFNSGLVRFDMT